MREMLRGALLCVLFFALPVAAFAEEGAVDECPEGHVCDTIIIKGEPYQFSTDWLYSPGGYGTGTFSGGAGMDSVGTALANLPTPYEMLLIKESARKAMCRNLAADILALTGGTTFFQSLKAWVNQVGRRVLTRGVAFAGLLLTNEILLFYSECPDFWGGSTYSHTDGIG